MWLGDGIDNLGLTENSKAEESSIKDLNSPDLCTVGLIRRNEELVTPREDTVFQKDDQVILVGKNKK